MENKQYVFVKINLDKASEDGLWFLMKYHRGFIGKLINQCYDTFYFELEEDGTMVSVPVKWVKWMMPVQDKETEKYNVRK